MEEWCIQRCILNADLTKTHSIAILTPAGVTARMLDQQRSLPVFSIFQGGQNDFGNYTLKYGVRVIGELQ